MPTTGAGIRCAREATRASTSGATWVPRDALIVKAQESATTESSSYWKGPKADRFRDDWHGVKPTFEKWVDTLNDASKSASTSADNIERAT